MSSIRIGTRKSKLAMWQTKTVAALLKNGGVEAEIVSMETKGDKILNKSIAKIGSKGVFTEELEARLASGDIDIAVHSAKDMPSRLPKSFSLIAFSEREKVNDVLLSFDKELRLAEGREVRIGTSSVRRVSLLRHYYPHVTTVDMRGNLQTRRSKMEDGQCDALMLAYAGVHRMDMSNLIVHTFPEDRFVPPVGQGCIAIEAGANLSETQREAVRAAVNHEPTETCLLAERAFLQTLEGGCSIPAFALATIRNDELHIHGGLVSLDGRENIHHASSGSLSNAQSMGSEMGEYILENGGRELLAAIRAEQG